MSEIDLSKLTDSVSAIFDDTFEKIKEVRVKSAIISLDEFYEQFEYQANERAARLPVMEHENLIEDFAAVFKSFEEYPENLSKPKKALRECSRMNSTFKNSTFALATESMISHGEDPSSSSLPTASYLLELEQESASTIFKKYDKFRTTLSVLMESAKQRSSLSSEYTTKLLQMDVFAQQMEKLIPTQGVAEQVFTQEEETKLAIIVANMKKLSYLQSNRDIFTNLSSANVTTNLNSQRLEGLAEVLSHSLISIGCYNDV